MHRRTYGLRSLRRPEVPTTYITLRIVPLDDTSHWEMWNTYFDHWQPTGLMTYVGHDIFVVPYVDTWAEPVREDDQ